MVPSKAKFTLLLLNAITFGLGIALFGLSARAIHSGVFNPSVAYGMMVLSVCVLGISFLGYFSTKKENRSLLLWYLFISVYIAILLFIFCGIAFNAAQDESSLIKVWDKMPYSKQRDKASMIGIELPESEADATDTIMSARNKVLRSVQGLFRTIGSIANVAGFALLVSIFCTSKLLQLWKEEENARNQAVLKQAQQTTAPQTAINLDIPPGQPIVYYEYQQPPATYSHAPPPYL